MRPPKNISLIVGLAIPILMILIVALSIYVPAIFSPQPQYNFLYVSGDDYWGGRQYEVQQGRLGKREVKHPDNYTPGVVRIFIHDVKTNESKEITFEEAQQLYLNSNSKSKDGWEVVYGSGGDGFFPFFYSGTNRHDIYLQGHNTSKKLNLQHDKTYYRQARFLGWLDE